MKRILVIAGVALGLVGIGAVAAYADNSGNSTHCTDNVTPSAEHDVPNGFVGVSYENPGPTTDPSYLQVCYSTTPNGSSSPEAAGGKVVIWNPSGGTAGGYCAGDRNVVQVVAVDCTATVTQTDPSGLPGTTVSLFGQVGPTSPAAVGQTGAEVNPATTVNLPLSGAAGTGGEVGTGAGTCTYVDGAPSCPFGFTVVGVNVAEGDVSAGVHPNPGGCVTVAGGCLTTVPAGVGVSAFKGDPNNPTIDADLAGVRITEDLGDCYVGVNAPSSC